MPTGLFIFDIEETFGPKIIAEYHLEGKVIPEALKILGEKHKSGLTDAICKKESKRYYSSLIDSKKIKEEVYLGFVLNKDEDVVSLKSLFESTEEKIAAQFDKNNKNAMQDLLRNTLESIMSLLDKIQEPKIIQDKINEKTKAMLDEGKLKEAKELIGLGETIPAELSKEVNQAEQYLKQRNYKKAKKGYLASAELAKEIQEHEMVSFLMNKAEQVGNLPELIKEKDNMLKDIDKMATELDAEQLKVFPRLATLIENAMNKASSLQEDVLVDVLSELGDKVREASNVAKNLYTLDSEIRKLVKKM